MKPETIEKLNEILDKVEHTSIDEFPHSTTFIPLPTSYWHENKRIILREILKRPNIVINLNAACGGGFKDGEKLISISPAKDLPPIEENEMERNIDEILGGH